MTWFFALLFLVAVLSGATATVVGFGIGSLLTPLLATRLGMPVAVAAVAIPHALATGLRCWRLRREIDREVLVRFGLVSAAGGLAGAMLYTRLGVSALTSVLGGLATATASGLMVDLARVPVYLWRAGDELRALVTPIGVASAGVLIGTLAGERMLLGLSPERFRFAISAAIGLLGLWLLSGMGR